MSRKWFVFFFSQFVVVVVVMFKVRSYLFVSQNDLKKNIYFGKKKKYLIGALVVHTQRM